MEIDPKNFKTYTKAVKALKVESIPDEDKPLMLGDQVVEEGDYVVEEGGVYRVVAGSDFEAEWSSAGGSKLTIK